MRGFRRSARPDAQVRGSLPTIALIVCTLVALAAMVPQASASSQSPPGKVNPSALQLVSWWKGDKNASDSIGTNNGTFIGNASYTRGHSGQAFDFTGDGSYVDVPNDSSQNIVGALTLSAWVKTAVAEGVASGGPDIAGKYDTHDSQTSYNLSFIDSNHIQFFVTGDCNFLTGSQLRSVETLSAIPVKKWTQVAGTFDPVTQNIHILVNGNVVATKFLSSATIGSVCASNTDFRIGAGETYTGDINASYNGQIDDVMLYGGDAVAGHHQYLVELKAWIPQAAVVDPLVPVDGTPGTLVPDVNKCIGALADISFMSSRYRGDGHGAYNGSYRVVSQAWVDLDATGNLASVQNRGLYGKTHRDQIADWPGGSRSCAGTGQAKRATNASVTGLNTFALGLSSSNPMVPGAPDIDSMVTGQFLSPTSLSLSWSTDQFPSHGIQITDGTRNVATMRLLDAFCVDALGFSGAANILQGLTDQSNNGSYVVDLTKSNQNLVFAQSNLC